MLTLVEERMSIHELADSIIQELEGYKDGVWELTRIQLTQGRVRMLQMKAIKEVKNGQGTTT